MERKGMARGSQVAVAAVAIIVVILVSVIVSTYTSSPGTSNSGSTGSTTGSQTTSVSVSSGGSTTSSSNEVSTTTTSTSTTTTQPGGAAPTGIIIPMFTNYSLIEVNQIISAKQAHPSVPFTVVANPDNGPGPVLNSSYAAGLKQLDSAGIKVLGYVPTTWGTRPIPGVEQDVRSWHQWYNVSGIYLDQMYNEEYSYNGNYVPTYYSTLTAFIKSLGYTEVFGNSGADIPYYFLGSVTTIGYFENYYLPSLSLLGGWHTNYTKGNYAFFTYAQSSIDPSYLAAASNFVGALFITNGAKPFPYNALPPYFDQLVSDLASLVPVTVQTQLPNGTSAPRGFQVTVTQPDGLSTTGYTPYTFDMVAGSSVTVSVANKAGYVFKQWGDGTTKTTITVSSNKPTTLLADSSTSVTNASLVTIRTNETNGGVPVMGIWTAAYANGVMVASGYTPFTFVATRGVNYTVTIQNYETYSFVSWSSGATTRDISFVPNSNLLLYAFVTNGTSTSSSSSSSSSG